MFFTVDRGGRSLEHPRTFSIRSPPIPKLSTFNGQNAFPKHGSIWINQLFTSHQLLKFRRCCSVQGGNVHSGGGGGGGGGNVQAKISKRGGGVEKFLDYVYNFPSISIFIFSFSQQMTCFYFFLCFLRSNEEFGILL